MTTHAVIFAPLGQATRSELVVERLSNAIVTGLLETHEQLPNEAELAKLMGVSHITIREALNTLRAKAFIYTTRGRNGGSFVCPLPKKKALEDYPLKNITLHELSDLGEFHCAIMKHCIELAIKRVTPKEVAVIQDFIELFRSSLTAEFQAQADMRCLLTIAAYAQSPRLANNELCIQAEWSSLVTILYQSSNTLHDEMIVYYEMILNAFKTQDIHQAVTQITAMINQLTLQLIEKKFALDRS